MAKRFDVQIRTKRIPLSRTSLGALRHLNRYDVIVFTSKNATRFFTKELRTRGITVPRHLRIIQVGPRADVLEFPIDNKRIIFPRSLLAPHDIVRHMRARGATVRVVPLYTSEGVALTKEQKKSLLGGKIDQLYFKSSSGITGLLRQLGQRERRVVQAISAVCIGTTTAQEARKAGFIHVSIGGVL